MKNKTIEDMMELALIALSSKSWENAFKYLSELKILSCQKNIILPQKFCTFYEHLSSLWWRDIKYGGLTISIPELNDFNYLYDTLNNDNFIQLYHKFIKRSADDINRIINTATLSPYQSKRIDWVISDKDCNRIGIASIVDIDWWNRRGEFLIGFPEHITNITSLKSSAAIMNFAFNNFKLEKLVSHVYSDNLYAQKNTIHLGFEQEGILRRHIKTSNGDMIDLFANGMLKDDFLNSAFYKKLFVRWGNK